jgi:hypothetical protein
MMHFGLFITALLTAGIVLYLREITMALARGRVTFIPWQFGPYHRRQTPRLFWLMVGLDAAVVTFLIFTLFAVWEKQ